MLITTVMIRYQLFLMMMTGRSVTGMLSGGCQTMIVSQEYVRTSLSTINNNPRAPPVLRLRCSQQGPRRAAPNSLLHYGPRTRGPELAPIQKQTRWIMMMKRIRRCPLLPSTVKGRRGPLLPLIVEERRGQRRRQPVLKRKALLIS